MAGQLAAAAGRILGTAAPDPQADFFDLGGSSLSAARLVSLARRTFQTPITLQDFLDKPTIAHLATLIERGPSSTAEKR